MVMMINMIIWIHMWCLLFIESNKSG